MSQDALRFKVRCPHCDKVFIVSAPGSLTTKEAPQAPAPPPIEEKPHPTPPPPPPEEIELEQDFEMTPEEEAFRERIVNSILEKKFELPMLPHVALKVIRLTSDTNANMQDLAKVILTDQTIVTKIIQISNSPVYAGTVEIKNINQALVRLGQTEIKNMMLAISLQTKIFKSKMYGNLAKKLWERSVGVAFASRVIAGQLKADKDEAFLCGLMHNLGKMITVTVIENAQRKMETDFKPSRLLVLRILKQFHKDVGELTIDKWSLPATVANTIHYIDRLDEIEENMVDVPIVALAEAFCRIAGIGGEHPEDFDMSMLPATHYLNLEADASLDLYDRFIMVFENARNEFIY